MLDFLTIQKKMVKGVFEISPKFRIYPKSKDLMVRGGDFYAVWDASKSSWSTNESDALRMIDDELDKYIVDNGYSRNDCYIKYMWDSDSGSIDSWHKYVQKQSRDSFECLDTELQFQNSPKSKEQYSSKCLPYALTAGDYSAWDKIIGTLYDEDERHKIEWAIGSVVCGKSKELQKFMVFYGSHGTGKSTILNIIQSLFDGYYTIFKASTLGSSSNQFALEAFRTNPLVAIEHDGDLSKIEDNTLLNSLVSHEHMMVNEKFKSTYTNKFNAFLFLGTNKPVRITDAKSGLIRRLIDVTPSGNTLPVSEYRRLIKQVEYELGAIAFRCKNIFEEDPHAYDGYTPLSMMGATNDFYNFVIDNYHIFKKDDGITLKAAWDLYKNFCEEAQIPYKASKRVFKEELKNYFRSFEERIQTDDGMRLRSYYSGFIFEKFEDFKNNTVEKAESNNYKIDFSCTTSILDEYIKDCPAQYTTKDGTPICAWDKVTTKLRDIDTTMLHYVKVPENHIVVDFDIQDENGVKVLDKNIEAASKWPPTYAELSKSGTGIHLHYIYTGDVNTVSRVFDEHIEIKIFTGKSSLRRKLTKCNDLPIAVLTSGLQKREEKKVIDKNIAVSEKMLIATINKVIAKELSNIPGTKCGIEFIKKITDDAYNAGIPYDISNMYNELFAYAAQSTHHSVYCLDIVDKMKLKSEEASENIVLENDKPIVFFDTEIFPNLFICNWKIQGKDKPIFRMINPTPSEIEQLFKYRLIGFNNRKYDNHIIYGAYMGYDNLTLYELSKKIIEGNKNCFFREAYNISYTDIYDFASAGNKKSLKKLEIEMGIHHQELGLDWNQPVPKEKWLLVAEYCDNDVRATEAAFEYLSADWAARQILADLAEMSVNDTTNTLSTRIIFGNNKKPQSAFIYRNMADPVFDMPEDIHSFLSEKCPEMMSTTHGDAGSLLPYFPGYKYEFGKSTYRGEDVGEGGWVKATVGCHVNVALLDVVSMHPHSTIAECLFGVEFTRAFYDIVYGRVNIKHEAWDKVNNMLNGKLTPYVQKVINGEMSSKDLANALKTAINSVYGLTAASFDNAFRDPRNIDNIVAKRGALFMIDLAKMVEEQGFTVAHVKTDSIKIPNATPEIIAAIHDFGKKYGYYFEHEATYEKMCLVNDAVYVAKYADPEHCKKMYGYIPGDNYKKGGTWTSTGTQFSVPYVFKSLFSKEKIEFEDLCETFSVGKGCLYLDMNENLPDVSMYEVELAKLIKKGVDIERQNELRVLIEEGHALTFIGRVGAFTPIRKGFNGGILYRVHENKNYAASGSTGYRWLESEYVKNSGKNVEAIIDMSFYTTLVDKAIDTINKFTDAEWFLSNDIIPWKTECGKDSCVGCNHLLKTSDDKLCGLGYDVSDYIYINNEKQKLYF